MNSEVKIVKENYFLSKQLAFRHTEINGQVNGIQEWWRVTGRRDWIKVYKGDRGHGFQILFFYE